MSEEHLEGTNDTRVMLRIMATSDVHATLLDYDYAKDRATRLGSLARAATVIEAARAECGATLVVDNGDFLQGAAIADPDHDEGVGVVNPVIAAMNAVKYDVVGLGNHEFNVPPQQLRRALLAAEFEVLCANLRLSRAVDSKVYAGLWKAKTIVPQKVRAPNGDEHEIQVGFFSVLPPQVVEWDKLRIQGRLLAEDMMLVALRQIADLQQAGADVIVALVHSGIAEGASQQSPESGALQIAALDGVDAVIGGHVHSVFPGESFAASVAVDPEAGTLHAVPAVMTGVYATHVGQIDLTLQQSEGRWSVCDQQVSIHDLTENGEAEPPEEAINVCAAVAEGHAKTLKRMRSKIGEVIAPVTSYFSMVRDDCASRLVAEAKLAFVREALRGSGLEHTPLLASVAPLKCGGRAGPFHYVDVPPGDVSTRVIADMQPYSNHISVVKLKGRDVAEWLEKGCAVYNQLVPGIDGQFLHDIDAPTYNREAIYGLSYLVDLSQPARYAMDGTLINPKARRVIDLAWRGIQIAPEQDFLLATNDYRGGGGGNFPVAAGAQVVPIPAARVRDVLADHIAATSGRRDPLADTWRLRPLADVTAFFDTGPGAAAYSEYAKLPARSVGKVAGGFERYALDLGKLQR